MDGVPGEEFFIKVNNCYDGECHISITRGFAIVKGTALIILSCQTCPKNVDLIWKEMISSFEQITQGGQMTVSREIESVSHAGIHVEYPNGWFFKPLSTQHFTISSFNTDQNYTGNYKGGLTIYIARCRSTLEECIPSVGLRGTDLLDQNLVDSLGGVVESVDSQTMKGVIYGQMDPIKYQLRSNPHNAFLVSKKDGTPISLHTELSLYADSFELTNRTDSYYYPVLKMIVKSMRML